MILSILFDAKIEDIFATASGYPVTNSALSVTNDAKEAETCGKISCSCGIFVPTVFAPLWKSPASF